MGKKSLIKSTSKKKKTTSKKKDEDKKSKVAGKTDVPKGKAGQKVEAKKKASVKKTASDKDLTLKDLIFKKFDREVPEKLFKVEAAPGNYTSPPIITTTDDQEAKRLKELLFKKIDLTSPPEKRRKVEEPEKPVADKKAKKPVEEKKVKKADYKEIMARKFHQPPSPEILAESPHKPVDIKKAAYTAPPLIATTDMKEAEWLKKLLFRKVDLTSPVEKKQEPEEVKTPEAREPIQDKKVETPVEEKEVKKADYKEIMARKFHEPQAVTVLAEKMEKNAEDYTAPPLISTDDPEKAARIKALLFRQFEIPPAPVQPATPTTEEKESETIVPETVSEKEETVAETKVEQMTSDTEKIEEDITEEEDKSPKVTVSYDEPPPTDTEVSDPMDKMIKFVAAGVILILLLIIGYSFNNKNKYYIKPVKDGIEIWQGRFAPMGEEVLARLTGVTPPEHIKDVYKAEEVMPLAFAYFVDQADGLLYTKGIPDLKAIKDTLDRALTFSLTKNEREIVNYRLNSMEKHLLQYRANIAASKGTPEDLSIAIGILTDVLKLDMDEQQKSMIQSRIEYLREYRDRLLAEEAQAEEVQAEEVQAEEVDAVQENAKEQEVPEEGAVGGEEPDKN
jgi:colicin import membrane protein